MARRKWDDQTISQTLAPLIAEFGRMPSRTELAERDLAALWSAMRRNGGTRVWAARAGELGGAVAAVDTAPREPPSAPGDVRSEPLEEQIRRRAYFFAMEGVPGGPEAHWLMAERELAA